MILLSWNRIKSFLIILFVIINFYLIYTTNGFELLNIGSVIKVDKNTIADTVSVIKNNYNIDIDPDIIPSRLKMLDNIDVTNIIFTNAAKNKGFTAEGTGFTFHKKTNEYSYNETNAKKEIYNIMKDLNIPDDSYTLKFSKSDDGLKCQILGYIDKYRIYDNYIEVNCNSKTLDMSGEWYIYSDDKLRYATSNVDIPNVTGMLIDASYHASAHSHPTTKKISDINYGYFVSYYDENAVNKSSTAIPCYLIKTDSGLEYYYDVLNGNLLKQGGIK